MRRMIPMLGAVLGLALLTGAGAAVQAPAAAAPVAAAPVAAVAVAAPATVAATDFSKKKLVLGPKGVGKLKLGMTLKQALATKLLKKRKLKNSGGGCNANYTLKGAPVFYSKKLGIVSIPAYKGLTTPQGIKLGSSAKAVKKAYPDWKSSTDEGLTGRGLAKVPGNKKAYYNITIAKGKVHHLQLQLRKQNCYE